MILTPLYGRSIGELAVPSQKPAGSVFELQPPSPLAPSFHLSEPIKVKKKNYFHVNILVITIIGHNNKKILNDLSFPSKPLFLLLGSDKWNEGTSGEGDCNTNTDPAGFCDAMANSLIDLPYNGVSIKRNWLPFQLLHYE